MSESENKRLLTYDPLFGIKEYMHFDETGDSFVVETIQDAEPVLERNKSIQNAVDAKKFGDGLQHVASIPMPIYLDWKRKGWIDDEKKLKELLNSSDNRFMRTHPMRL